MNFELTVLGCGSATPSSITNPSAQLLKMAERFYLIDCGEGCQQQLRRAKARFARINHIFISHLHGDHFFGLPGLISSFYLLNRTNKLCVYGPPALEQMLKVFMGVEQFNAQFEIEFIATQNNKKALLLDDGKVEVYSIPLKHSIATTGFLFQEKTKERHIKKEKIEELHIPYCDIQNIKNGKDWQDEIGKVYPNLELTTDPPKSLSYAYCSDTAFFKNIINQIKGVDLLYHESTFLKKDEKLAEKTRHSTAEQAAEMANLVEAKNLLLGHFSIRYKNKDCYLDEAKTLFDKCYLARDLNTFVVDKYGLKVKSSQV